ncbi:MAG: sulfite exporter TauE/SafE family protein [Candidatus Marinimicrobia bacterium]|nr:sulfite exporter TauE/SafE family protein [Candidatus Neomarinimicrobiota bacterium]
MIYLLLFIVGIVAGFINSLAGGGSTLTLPVLILAGLPSPIANATNRVGILFQTGMATSRFKKHKQLEVKPYIHITVAAIIGAIIGSLFVVNISSQIFDKLLGIVLIFIMIMILIPRSKMNNTHTIPKWVEILIFLGVGFYGGFVQAGIGFIFLITLNFVEKFSLLKANAIKVFIIFCYTVFTIIIFQFSGKIVWSYGLLLATGNMIGAYIGVKSAIEGGEKLIKIVISTAIILASMKLFGVFALVKSYL